MSDQERFGGVRRGLVATWTVRPPHPPQHGLELPLEPSAANARGGETCVVLAGGRRTPANDAVTITGDRNFGRRLLDPLVVAP